MDAETQAGLVREGGKLLSDLIRMGFAAHVKKTTSTVDIESFASKPALTGDNSGPPAPVHRFEMASTAETIDELRRRLGKELYRAELDLQNGGRINGKICDCLGDKHHFGIEATAEELMSYIHDPVLGQTISWMKEHAKYFTPEAIADHQVEFYRAMIPEVRAMRKQVMGTEDLHALLNADQLAKVAAPTKEPERA